VGNKFAHGLFVNALQLCHRYYHFSLHRWAELFAGREPSYRELKTLFREDLFPRRVLRQAFPCSLEEASERHELLLERDEAMGVRVVKDGTSAYPKGMSEYLPVERRPALLYMRGAPLPPEDHCLAMVGTRSPSPDGMDAASSFAAYFSLLGIHIVSGLARGIDTICHRENLKVGTIAVLGSSVTEIYPPENLNLAEEILSSGGTLLSPFPSGQAAMPANFPQRNELIAAIATGTLVVEGAEKSGAAITGKQSLAMGKSTAVLSTDFRSAFGRGAIRLHQDGASFVADEEDALQTLYCRLGGFAGPAQRRGINIKEHQTFTMAEFCAASGEDLPIAIATLQEGIVSGRIVRTGPDRYKIQRRNGA
jgi:DNA protecting protein DprA